mmetsp:Transcript_35658/g.60080  ORF Transcript_35658/g.60080 Transcript_35658/m.60080 type:complete len:236 (+) Transcript_35658:629-1336(+)
MPWRTWCRATRVANAFARRVLWTRPPLGRALLPPCAWHARSASTRRPLIRSARCATRRGARWRRARHPCWPACAHPDTSPQPPRIASSARQGTTRTRRVRACARCAPPGRTPPPGPLRWTRVCRAATGRWRRSVAPRSACRVWTRGRSLWATIAWIASVSLGSTRSGTARGVRKRSAKIARRGRGARATASSALTGTGGPTGERIRCTSATNPRSVAAKPKVCSPRASLRRGPTR